MRIRTPWNTGSRNRRKHTKAPPKSERSKVPVRKLKPVYQARLASQPPSPGGAPSRTLRKFLHHFRRHGIQRSTGFHSGERSASFARGAFGEDVFGTGAHDAAVRVSGPLFSASAPAPPRGGGHPRPARGRARPRRCSWHGRRSAPGSSQRRSGPTRVRSSMGRSA